MISINNTTPQVSISAFSSVAGSPVDTAKSAALRPATDIVKLGATATGKPGEAPELRAPRTQSQGISERDEMGKAMSISGLIAMLIGMLSQLMLQDSQRVNASSAREVKLAETGANAQRKAGNAELGGGLSQAATMMAATAFGAYRSMKGTNMQIKSTRTNQPASLEAQKLSGGNSSPDAKKALSTIGGDQATTHQELNLKGGKFQTQGDAMRSGGTALSKVAEASQGAAVNAHRAEQTVASADASVAGRTTDIELKTRGMTDELMNQMRAIRDRDNQSKSDAASHVAQGTR